MVTQCLEEMAETPWSSFLFFLSCGELQRAQPSLGETYPESVLEFRMTLVVRIPFFLVFFLPWFYPNLEDLYRSRASMT